MKNIVWILLGLAVAGCSECKEQRANELQLDCHVREWLFAPDRNVKDDINL